MKQSDEESSNNFDYIFTKYLEILIIISDLSSETIFLELFYNGHHKPIDLVLSRLL